MHRYVGPTLAAGYLVVLAFHAYLFVHFTNVAIHGYYWSLVVCPKHHHKPQATAAGASSSSTLALQFPRAATTPTLALPWYLTSTEIPLSSSSLSSPVSPLSLPSSLTSTETPSSSSSSSVLSPPSRRVMSFSDDPFPLPRRGSMEMTTSQSDVLGATLSSTASSVDHNTLGVSGLDPRSSTANLNTLGVSGLDPRSSTADHNTLGVSGLDPRSSTADLNTLGVSGLDPRSSTADLNTPGFSGLDPPSDEGTHNEKSEKKDCGQKYDYLFPRVALSTQYVAGVCLGVVCYLAWMVGVRNQFQFLYHLCLLALATTISGFVSAVSWSTGMVDRVFEHQWQFAPFILSYIYIIIAVIPFLAASTDDRPTTVTQRRPRNTNRRPTSERPTSERRRRTTSTNEDGRASAEEEQQHHSPRTRTPSLRMTEAEWRRWQRVQERREQVDALAEAAGSSDVIYTSAPDGSWRVCRWKSEDQGVTVATDGEQTEASNEAQQEDKPVTNVQFDDSDVLLVIPGPGQADKSDEAQEHSKPETIKRTLKNVGSDLFLVTEISNDEQEQTRPESTAETTAENTAQFDDCGVLFVRNEPRSNQAPEESRPDSTPETTTENTVQLDDDDVLLVVPGPELAEEIQAAVAGGRGGGGEAEVSPRGEDSRSCDDCEGGSGNLPSTPAGAQARNSPQSRDTTPSVGAGSGGGAGAVDGGNTGRPEEEDYQEENELSPLLPAAARARKFARKKPGFGGR